MNAITQAFVLGAGLGLRLRPLTDDVPKPLIPVFQKPLITFALDHLIDIGVSRFIINTHRLPELFQNFFGADGYDGHSITLVHEPQLLEMRETGLATQVAFRDHRVVDIANRYGIAGNFDFANVAIWNRAIFQRIPPQRKISFIPVLADWIGQGGKIGGVVINEGKWFNISSRAEYLDVHRMIIREHWKPHYVKTGRWPERVAKTALVDHSAQLRGCTVVARGCHVGAAAILEDTILWPDAEIASQSRLEGCIVRSQKKASGIHHNIDI